MLVLDYLVTYIRFLAESVSIGHFGLADQRMEYIFGCFVNTVLGILLGKCVYLTLDCRSDKATGVSFVLGTVSGYAAEFHRTF